ncbi:MAG: hypothetical protein HKO95_12520 [Rhodobacteraceae bacterium]|nr:hypothetical protein [Alphaproteobacteria bacterium]NNK67546.1 hypothetical protein [Paracoccaceae bacterium]
MNLAIANNEADPNSARPGLLASNIPGEALQSRRLCGVEGSAPVLIPTRTALP